MSDFLTVWGLALPIAITFTGLFILFLLASIFLGVVDDMLSIFDLELGGGLYVLSFITVSGILGGISIGAWTYIYMSSTTDNPMLYSAIAGIVALLATGILKKSLFSMGNSKALPSFKVNIGDVGTVYIRVHPEGKHGGQATFSDQYHRSSQLNVITNSPEEIPNGRQVEIVDIKGSEANPLIYVVEHK